MKAVLLLLLGLVGLWLGSGLVVESAKKLSKKLGISQTFIGLTIISIGTSLPEIATNIHSGLKDASGIAVGTNIGSCLTQITLIFGLVGLIGTLRADETVVKRDGRMVLVAIIAMFFSSVFIGTKVITRYEGFALVIAYIYYLWYLSKKEGFIEKVEGGVKHFEKHKESRLDDIKNLIGMAIGIFLLISASDLVVNNAILLAEKWAVAQSFIGVMIIGVGTGLPELSTAIRAILKRAGDISVGTLIGSNVTDPMFSLGTGAIASSKGLVVDSNLIYFDIPYWFFATILAIFFLKRRGELLKKEAIVLLLLYAAFLGIKLNYFMR